MRKWVIIGGGIQGTTIAVHLLEKEVATTKDILIIDPHDHPLEKWKQMTSRISMPFLRSPFVHHISSSPFSLDQFGKKYQNQQKVFLGRYHRPKLTFFNEHCNELINHHQLEKSWLKGSVNGLTKSPEGWHVKIDSGETIHAKHVILALGLSQQPFIPNNLIKAREQGAAVHHIFEEGLDLQKLQHPIAIVGGGITAVHTAISLVDKYPRNVTLIKRHPFRVHSFDSDPGWLGPKNMHRFSKLTDYKQRRKSIFQARHRGSITRELYLKIKKLERNSELTIQTMNITDISCEENKILSITDDEKGVDEKASTIICCTGFEPSLPGGTWLKDLISRYSLPCAQCGYPIVSRSLMWADGLFVTGALAELEIGPIARNISGAQKAASIISENFLKSTS
ncbi:FAD/NAD(P)-binding protein [Salipaludibacillus sp. HK11]|uniref:FAD/NAD(P)-binding protein n=1 Tax=Salipaludibacillus sp. HK11 TaxID=3394320 RepID=UPI0039FD186C